jgi:hypothetical protein
MKPTVRMRVCEACGNVLLRSTPRLSHTALDTTPVLVEHRRNISWKSFLGVFGTKAGEQSKSTKPPPQQRKASEGPKFTTKSAPIEHQKPVEKPQPPGTPRSIDHLRQIEKRQPIGKLKPIGKRELLEKLKQATPRKRPEDDKEAKEKAAKKAQQLRETKDASRRQQTRPPQRDTILTIISSKHRTPPHKPRPPPLKPTTAQMAEPPVRNKKTAPEDISRLLAQQKPQLESQRKLIDVLHSRSFIFKPGKQDPMKKVLELFPQEETPLPTKRVGKDDSITKYLDDPPQKGQFGRTDERLPWDEEPLEEGQKTETLQNLLKLIPHRRPLVDSTNVGQAQHSEYIEREEHDDTSLESDLTYETLNPEEHVLQASILETSLQSSQLYQSLLTQHNDIYDHGKFLPNVSIPRFEHTIEAIATHLTSKTAKLRNVEQDLDILAKYAQVLRRKALEHKPSEAFITPLIRYILLSHGFWTDGLAITPRIEQFVDKKGFEETGCIHVERLHSMVLARKCRLMKVANIEYAESANRLFDFDLFSKSIALDVTPSFKLLLIRRKLEYSLQHPNLSQWSTGYPIHFVKV